MAESPFWGSDFMSDPQKGIAARQKGIGEADKADALKQKAVAESQKGGSIHKKAGPIINQAIGNYKKHPA